MGERALIIGATLLDTKGRPLTGLEPSTSNPAEIRSVRGGTARNVAENLARLGAEVTLISAVGDDVTGERLVAQTGDSGVDLSYLLTVPDQPTGSYIALLDDDGQLSVALDDVRVMAAISPDYLERHESLFAATDMVMMDGSLTSEAMGKVVELSRRYQVPLCADPSSARVAYKLRPFLPYLHLVVPNAAEEAELCEVPYGGHDPSTSLALARRLVKIGVAHVVVTLSDFGLDYATVDEIGYIPPKYVRMVDTTGTGDAVTAAIMFGMMNNLPAVESIRLGAAAAGLTLQTTETVVPELSLDLLYEHLTG